MSRPLACWLRGAFSSRATCMAFGLISVAARAIQLLAFYYGLSSAGVRLLRAPWLTPARLGACRYKAVQYWADARPAGPTVYPAAVPGTLHVHTSMCRTNRRPLANALASRAGVPLSEAQEAVRADAASVFAHYFAGEARGRRDGAGSDCGVHDTYSCEELDVFSRDLRLSLDSFGKAQMVADHERAPLVPVKYSGGPGNENAAYKNFRLTDIERSVHEGCVLPVHEHARACVQDARAKARGEPVPSTAGRAAKRATPTGHPAGAARGRSNGAKRANSRIGEGGFSAFARSSGAGHGFVDAAGEADAGAESAFRDLGIGTDNSFGFGGDAGWSCEWPLAPFGDALGAPTGNPLEPGTGGHGRRGHGVSPDSVIAGSGFCAVTPLYPGVELDIRRLTNEDP